MSGRGGHAAASGGEWPSARPWLRHAIYSGFEARVDMLFAERGVEDRLPEKA